MFIPRAMKTEIAKAFYDKEIHLMNKSTETDSEGGVKTKGYNIKDMFKGNVNFSNCAKLQQEYGLEYEVSISITTHYTGLKLDDILCYNKVLYEIKGIYAKDSHTLVLASKCKI